MKRIIDGKLYNTENAELITINNSGLSMSDFRYFSESLYKTKKGNFFLHGEGHAMTKYAKSNGNTSMWGEKIIPLSLGELYLWMEVNNIDPDKISNILPLVEA